jgi:hypothetical protein
MVACCRAESDELGVCLGFFYATDIKEEDSTNEDVVGDEMDEDESSGDMQVCGRLWMRTDDCLPVRVGRRRQRRDRRTGRSGGR